MRSTTSSRFKATTTRRPMSRRRRRKILKRWDERSTHHELRQVRQYAELASIAAASGRSGCGSAGSRGPSSRSCRYGFRRLRRCELTCVPPQGWLSIAAFSPMQTSRILPVPDGRANVLRFHQPRIGRKLLVGDPAREDRMVGAHQFHQPRRHVFLGEAGIRNVEIDAAVVLADRRPGDRKRTHDGQQMAGRVHAHQLQPALPVDRQRHRLADARQRLVRPPAHG